MRNIDSVTPGELLKEEFLNPMGISQYRLAKEIGVPAQRIGQIIAGKRAITADTDLRLCRFFKLSSGYWLQVQAAYDIRNCRRSSGWPIEKYSPLESRSTYGLQGITNNRPATDFLLTPEFTGAG
ncbi:HigA family addiction module antitoxin [Nitrosococcus oceani]|uniref:HigA family addiction module antitoxin n=1 Tax=Nitrosococcus oceani TaxID=1229 RepID=UPI000B1D35BB|nr:HigA family addiction module antitoxin [Nitrosococcus oceani]